MTAQPNEETRTPVLGDLDYWTEPAGLTPTESLHYRRGYSRGARTYTRKVGPPAVQHEGKGDAPAPGTAAHAMLGRQLAAAGREHRAERHPVAHKAGMAAVRKYVRAHAPERLELIADPLAPVKARKPATRKPRTAPAPTVPDELAAGIASGRVILSVVTDTPRDIPDHGITREDLAAAGIGPDSRIERVTYTPEPVDTAPVLVPFTDRRKLRRELAATMRAHGVRPSGYAWEMACRATGLPVVSVTR